MNIYIYNSYDHGDTKRQKLRETNRSNCFGRDFTTTPCVLKIRFRCHRFPEGGDRGMSPNKKWGSYATNMWLY